ncbi:hypothetical protein [Deinococcus sonorensis]|uniref:UDP-glucose 6-dehydrogenase n=2 Tax=Deinococcus sonorensis TaxID=309891 RepID=A0AAU7UGE3_9DEIO
MPVSPLPEAPAPCAVIGLGPVGLSLTALLAALGHPVWAAEHDPLRRAQLLAGQLPFHEPGLGETLAQVYTQVRYVPTSLDFPGDVTWVYLCVGTPGTPGGAVDLTALDRAWETLLSRAVVPPFIVLRSTLPLGAAERYQADLSRRAPGAVLLYQPEFLQESRAMTGVFFPDRLVIGGPTAAAQQLAQLQRPVTEGTLQTPTLTRPPGWTPAPVQRVSLTEATLIKLATNAFLAMKISFANEISDLCEHAGADMRTVSAGLGLDPRIGAAFLDPRVRPRLG